MLYHSALFLIHGATIIHACCASQNYAPLPLANGREISRKSCAAFQRFVPPANLAQLKDNCLSVIKGASMNHPNRNELNAGGCASGHVYPTINITSTPRSDCLRCNSFSSELALISNFRFCQASRQIITPVDVRARAQLTRKCLTNMLATNSQ